MELRKDPITRSWVLIGDDEADTLSSPSCPYCLGSESSLGQPILAIPTDGQPGGLRVYPHPRPLYRIEGEANRRADGIYDRMRSLGAHEVIVESPDHDYALVSAPPDQVAALLRCWALRITDLKNDLRFRYVTVFRNRGELAGQQIRHPHSELTATTFIPRRIVYELRAALEYYQMKERCVFCDIGQQEEQQGLRVVDLTPRYLAVCPFASRVPYELWILPRYHHSSFEADILRHPDQTELAGILQRTLTRLEQLTQEYHLVLHTSPNTLARTEMARYWTTIDEDYHWHIEILPITEKRSKSYSIKEVYYCALTPEEAATRLRELPGMAGPRRQAVLQFQPR
ncbi:MAG TPA: galactose-1-phosphate uridylyltransferase [Terriglobia bacterium]|nr:galactose-1-phosphate uridylyltransferase [Terriglobia bacterium]